MSNSRLLFNFKRGENFSPKIIRVSEILDLPNFLPSSAETGNLAYFDDQVWYRSSSGWKSLSPPGGVPSGDIVIDGTITTNTLDLILNPQGQSVDFSGKDITNVSDMNSNSVTTNVISSQGNLLISPLGTSIDFSGKDAINIANVFSNTITANTIITGQGNLVINPNGTSVIFGGKNLINIGNIVSSSLSTANLSVSNLITSPGNLLINPQGQNVDFGGKNIINADISTLRIPPLFTGILSSFFTASTSAVQFYQTGGVSGSLIVPFSFLDQPGKGLVLTSSLRATFGVAGDFIFTIRVNTTDIPVTITSVSPTPVVYDYRCVFELLTVGISPDPFFECVFTLIPLSAGAPPISFSTSSIILLGPSVPTQIPIQISGRYTNSSPINGSSLSNTIMKAF